MGQFTFEPSARLQKFLGRELIADPNVAIAEFVKNSYDAGATKVGLEFRVKDRERDSQELIITDDGIGMDQDSFERNWMHPGYSEKAQRTEPDKTRNTGNRAEKLSALRVPIGEKGVGRLAAGRLGEMFEVFTRRSVEDQWLHVVFDWSTFDSMYTPLRDIKVPFDYDTQPDRPRVSAGTIVRISELSLDWRSRVPGRKVSGRSDLRLGRLKEDLSILVQPLSGGPGAGFQVGIKIDDPEFSEQVGAIEAGEPDWDAYRFDFSLEEAPDGRPRVKRRLRRAPNIAFEIDQSEDERFSPFIVTSSSDPAYEDDMRPLSLKSGPFDGYFLYTTLPWKRRGRLGSPPGVLLYRDGVRVPPYGDDDDDWLGAKARKASRQGYAIQPDNLWGRVYISKKGNATLTDMSNRSGLVENDAYEDLLGHIRAEFRFFAETVLAEYIRPNWRPATARARQQASDNLDYQNAVAQLAVHRMRGPLGAVRVDLKSAELLLARLEERQIADRILEKLRRADSQITALDQSLEDYFMLSSEAAPEVDEFDIADAVREAIEQVRGAAEAREIDINSKLPSRRIVLARRVVVDSIGNLLNNAIEVVRPEERKPGRVTVQIERGGRGVQVIVGDDGVGMNAEQRASVFSGTGMEKGHVGLGLARTRRSLRLFGAEVDLKSTDDGGSIFYLDLPTMGTQRKRGN